MTRILLAGLATLAATAALAETHAVAVKRNAASAIGSYARYFIDTCRAADTSDVRIATQAAHGVASLGYAPLSIGKGEPCAGAGLKGLVVTYRPKPGFAGKDRVVIAIPMSKYEERYGGYQEIVYDITVQ